MARNFWKNDDGLPVRFGTQQQSPEAPSVSTTHTKGMERELVVHFSYDNLVGFTSDADNDGTLDEFTQGIARIPAKSYITEAFLIATTDWQTSNSATLTIGLVEADGTEIDNDGIDAAIGAGALDLGDVVSCNGALVGGTVWTSATADGYVRATAANTWTTGTATLVIRYITPTAPFVSDVH